MDKMKIGDKVVLKKSGNSSALRHYYIKRIYKTHALLRYEDNHGWEYESDGITYTQGSWIECVVPYEYIIRSK